MENLFYTFGALLLSFVFLRWIFRIDDLVNSNRACVWFLMKLCEKNGVDQKELDDIRKAFKVK